MRGDRLLSPLREDGQAGARATLPTLTPMPLIPALSYTLGRARALALRLGEDEVLTRLAELERGSAFLTPGEQVEVLREVADLTRRLWKRQDALEGFPGPD